MPCACCWHAYPVTRPRDRREVTDDNQDTAICGAPLIRWSVLWLRAQGVREIVINLHHLGEQIEHELGDGSALCVTQRALHLADLAI